MSLHALAPISEEHEAVRTVSAVIIDANAGDREFIRQALMADADHRFGFREAQTGSEGIAICREAPRPDCVLLALRLPDMSGLELLEKLRNGTGLPCPVIVLTAAHNTARERKAAMLLGAQDFLDKAFMRPESLSRALVNAMERFALAERVKRSERYFRTLFEAQGVANAQTDAKSGKYLRVNRRFCELTGYSEEEMLGTSYLELTHPEDRERNAAARELAITERWSTFEIEKRYVRKDGQVIWVHVSTTLMRDDSGEVSSLLGSVFDITAQKQAGAATRLATSRFEIALRGSPIVVFNQDSDLRYTWIYHPALGYDPKQIIGRRDSEIFEYDEDALRTEAIKRDVIRTGIGRRDEVTVRWRGAVQHFDLHVDPTRDDSGRITGVTCAAIDITQRKLARLALSQTSEQLRLFAERAPAAIAMFDRQMRYITTSRRWMSEFGLTGQALSGKSHYEIFPDLPERWIAAHRRCLEGAVERADEDFYEDASGPHWFRWEIHPWRDATGGVGGIVIFSENISERKRAEQALKASEERFRLAAAATHAMVFDLDVGSMRLNSMQGLEELLGYVVEPDELTLEWWEARIAPDDLRTRHAALAAMREHPQPQHLEYRMLHADGRTIWVADDATPVLDDAGRLARIVGTIVDITERKHATLALQEADRTKDRFIATLAHELRNPLAPVANAASVMSELALTDPKLLWCRDVIERQVSQMARLLDDLLDVSRITRNKLPLQREQVELATVIEYAVEMARPLIDEAGHELSIALPDHPVQLYGDRVRLAQIFSNLLTNAAKYTPHHGRIAVSAREEAGELVVGVQDNGIGLAAEDLTRVFRMFGQIESALERSQGGLGIGLALIKGLVEMHGGRIHAHSDGPAKGSRFEVWLPLPAEPRAPAPARKKSAQSAVARRILVVDDIRDNAETLAFLLQLAGHQIETACDGKQAFRMAQEYRPDVILLDIGLPEMNGFDTCRAIRAQPWGKKILIVAVTGWGQEEDRRRSHSAGFDAHLTKPLDHSRLKQLLEAGPPLPA